jgi:hypothetical protein
VIALSENTKIENKKIARRRSTRQSTRNTDLFYDLYETEITKLSESTGSSKENSSKQFKKYTLN